MARRSVEIKKIEDRSKRQVTFTKRRQGLFKKAGELHSKCNADVAVIAFSLAGNAYAFGDPSVSSLLDRYNKAVEVSPDIEIPVAGEVSTAERKAGEMLEKVVETRGGRREWDKEVEKLGEAEIDAVKVAMEEMKKKIVMQQRRILAEASNL
ncbi:K-box region and MADS-box transcription factor family protein [Heracleum sosnowskyi]|uniref:K-box region and MADS-box transcription factor family protein n=1 Tax=Heracleum sosnowskyi TaxID=360622 RepID=A0AAD8JDJ2_9APIA|nr:K-box region and MADS-box transcription factor family protein [Heracleum sosnowskyi]